MRVVTPEDYEGLRNLQQYCREQSVLRGFGTEGDRLRREVVATHAVAGFDSPTHQDALTNLRNYYANRLMLIVGELIEVHEELRTGRSMTERYVTTKGEHLKPEGVPSEMADVLIRLLDLTAEAEIDIAEDVRGKLAFNATRETMHGKKF